MKSNYNYLVRLIKPVGLQKIKVIIMTIINLLFTSFTETFKTLKIGHWSINTTLDEFKKHKLINH